MSKVDIYSCVFNSKGQIPMVLPISCSTCAWHQRSLVSKSQVLGLLGSELKTYIKRCIDLDTKLPKGRHMSLQNLLYHGPPIPISKPLSSVCGLHLKHSTSLTMIRVRWHKFDTKSHIDSSSLTWADEITTLYKVIHVHWEPQREHHIFFGVRSTTIQSPQTGDWKGKPWLP